MGNRPPEESEPVANEREVRYEHSPGFPGVLEHLRASLLVSAYQAGKLAAVGVQDGRLTFSFHNFDKAMGLAVGARQIAIGTRREVHVLHESHQIAASIEPAGQWDSCWTTRRSLNTGNIHGHELAWGENGLWIFNTLFSSLCTLSDGFSFVPQWRPPFISELAPQDRCHLNGMAMEHSG